MSMIRNQLTSSSLNQFINFVPCVHCTKIEQLHYWPGILQFWCIIWRWCELLDYPSANASCWLFSLEHRTVAKITLDKEDHLVVSHQDLIGTNIVEPSLKRGLDTSLVFVCTSTSRCQRRWDGWYNSLGIRGYKVVRKFNKFRVCSSNIAELGSSKFWEIGLGGQQRFIIEIFSRTQLLTCTSNLKIGSFLPVRSSPVILACNL